MVAVETMNERGLTLLEVLASLALMTLLTVTALPLAQDCARALSPTPTSLDDFSFEQDIDRWFAEQDSLTMDLRAATISTNCGKVIRGRAIQASDLLTPGSLEQDEERVTAGTWWAFETGSQLTFRWVAIPKEDIE